MATKISSLARFSQKLHKSGILAQNQGTLLVQTRNVAERSMSIPGPIPPRPLRTRFSLPIVFACIGLGIFVGQTLAKRFAIFMEETEMFVPEDDDD